MTPLDIDRIRQVDDFESLVVFLRDELEWPLQAEDIEELSFDYEPEELGLSEEVAVKINSIKQLRPLAENQPWGIFYIDFEPKKLPVVVLRRVLQKLVIKKRQSAEKAHRIAWEPHDLLFINSFGETQERSITFAHFKQEENNLPTLKVIGWDGQDTPLHLDRCLNELGYLRYDADIDAETWRTSWSAAFTTTHRHTISTSKKLAARLAELAKAVRINTEHILKYETENGRFKKAMAKFKTALIHDLTEEDFADMYAQTIAYGLLYTAIRSHVSGEATVVSSERVQQLVLPTNPFLKEVMEDFFNIGSRKWDSEKEMITGIEFDELGINEIITTLKDQRTDFDAILRDFGNKNPNEDPVIHFYELFLKEYDALKRKSRGVYYTPRPVVSFIVRSVNEVLKRDFNLPLGLADTTNWGKMHQKNPDIKIPAGVSEDDFFVQVLDPALGTGTFIVETIDLIHNTMVEKWQNEGKTESEIEKLWNEYVPDCLLPRLYGFELMMAPYAIAHMKIGIKLFETGYQNFQQDNKRVRVYLTNTLEKTVDVTEYLDTLDPAMAEETREANEIKRKNSVSVVIGNPPYSGLSLNMNPWVNGLLKGQIPGGPKLRSYYEVDGKPLGERKLWLQDDYVKFIRYAQYRLDNTGVGVLGFITNHAYLDNPTFRGMRQALIESFNSIEILDLHGNAKKKEKCPDGSPDKNVFDIQQGVGIALFRNIPGHAKCSVCHAELWGRRENKYTTLLKNTAHTIDFSPLSPNSPFYFFVLQDETHRDEYESGIKLDYATLQNNVGVVTARDKLTIAFTADEIWNRVRDFARLAPEVARTKYDLRNDVRDWKVSLAQADLNSNPIDRKKVVRIMYRPFDIRYTYYTGKIRGFIGQPAKAIMHHMFAGSNIGLITVRQVAEGVFNHALVTENIVESRITISNKGMGYLFPLYLSPESGTFKQAHKREPNFQVSFIEGLTESLKLKWVNDGSGNLRTTIGPRDVLNYIYAQLNSPVYRDRYIVFLKTDYPRFFLTKNITLFQELCSLGRELVALHLLNSEKLDVQITTFPISGDNAVTKVGEKGKTLADVENGKGKLFINKTQYFGGLPEEVWNFHIGGYQVCYKWLYNRKKAGRKLSAEDIEHYHKIVVAINETIKIMKQIDEVIDAHGGWPLK